MDRHTESRARALEDVVRDFKIDKSRAPAQGARWREVLYVLKQFALLLVVVVLTGCTGAEHPGGTEQAGNEQPGRTERSTEIEEAGTEQPDGTAEQPGGVDPSSGTDRSGTGTSSGADGVADAPDHRLQVYRVADLLSGEAQPVRSALLEPGDLGWTLSPDGRRAILFASPWSPAEGLHIVDLESGSRRRVHDPEPNWYAYAGWLPDGHMLLVGRQVWVGAGDGTDWQLVAETGLTWTVTPSPSWQHLALWGPLQDGQVTIVDLADGTARRVDGPFRRCVADGGQTLAWSPDGRQLAGGDCDRDVAANGPKIRIIDPFGEKEVRVIPGPLLVNWLPDGRLLGSRRAENSTVKGPATTELVLIDDEGEMQVVLDSHARPSPDGEWLVRTTYGDDSRHRTELIELATGRRHPVDLPPGPSWTLDGDLYVLKRLEER